MNSDDRLPFQRLERGVRFSVAAVRGAGIGAIVGVPTDLVSATARTNVSWDDQASRDTYYDSILNDPRMQEVPENENVPAIANLRPSCSWTDTSGASATAFAPRRIVEVAKGIGTNSLIQSICQNDFSEPTDAIVELIG